MPKRVRKPFGVYDLLDSEPEIALIRYDGDPDVFTALAWTWLMKQEDECESGHYSVEPPQPRLYRFNPTDDPDYSWTVGRPAKRGPGVFTGAVLTRAKSWRCGYCFAAKPGHEDGCVKILREQAARTISPKDSGGAS